MGVRLPLACHVRRVASSGRGTASLPRSSLLPPHPHMLQGDWPEGILHRSTDPLVSKILLCHSVQGKDE